MCILQGVSNESVGYMFKITHNTVHRFSFTEILLMAALNEVEAKRKVGRK
jgi:hypothetical protein